MQSIQNLPATVQHRTVLNMQITKFLLQPSGQYRTQHYRPLTMDVNNDALASLGNELDRAGGRVENMDINGFAAKTLQFSSSTLSPVFIPNGWDTERYTFELEVLITTSVGTVQERLTGWSEHCDRSLQSGLNDEGMMFIVNSVHKQRLNQVHGPSGTQNVFAMQSASQVFYEPTFETSFNFENTPKMIRPYDVYGRLAIDQLDPTGAWAREMGTGMQGPGTFLDARGAITGSAETSRRSNALMGNYLQRTLSAFSTANQAHSAGMTEASYADFSSVFSEARKNSQISEVPISESDFLAKLSRTRYHTSTVEPRFTLADIYEIDPSLRGHDPRFQINEYSIATSPFSAADWNGGSHEALAATYLAHSIPAIMVKCGASGLSVIMQNTTATMPQVMIQGHQELHLQYIGLVEQMISNEIMPILTMNGHRMVSCKYICNALSMNTQILISLNGGDEAFFEVPQFADARFSPMITSEAGAHDFTQVLNSTMQSIGAPVTTQFGEPTPMDLNELASRRNVQQQQTSQLGSLLGGASNGNFNFGSSNNGQFAASMGTLFSDTNSNLM